MQILMWIELFAFIAALAYGIVISRERDEWRSKAEQYEAINIANNSREAVNGWRAMVVSDMVEDLKAQKKEALRMLNEGDYYGAQLMLEKKP